MQIVEVLTVNEKVKHVVALAANLQPDLHPVQLRRLKEFGSFERAKQIPLLLRFGRPMFEGIQHIILKQLLIGDSNFHRLPSRTVLPIPG